MARVIPVADARPLSSGLEVARSDEVGRKATDPLSPTSGSTFSGRSTGRAEYVLRELVDVEMLALLCVRGRITFATERLLSTGPFVRPPVTEPVAEVAAVSCVPDSEPVSPEPVCELYSIIVAGGTSAVAIGECVKCNRCAGLCGAGCGCPIRLTMSGLGCDATDSPSLSRRSPNGSESPSPDVRRLPANERLFVERRGEPGVTVPARE